jgi:nucleoside recognition membrane protein YjiH
VIRLLLGVVYSRCHGGLLLAVLLLSLGGVIPLGEMAHAVSPENSFRRLFSVGILVSTAKAQRGRYGNTAAFR